MSPEIIDLISSSPSPPLRHAGEGSRDAAQRHTVSGTSALASLSDYDDIEFELGESRRKRRRTSPEPKAQLQSRLPSRPPLVLGHIAPLHPRVPDPIEVSSSMEQAPPQSPRHVGSERPLACTLAPSRAAAFLDSDPFGSSPTRLNTNARLPARRAVSLDPFIGSSSPVGDASLTPRRSALGFSHVPAQRERERSPDQGPTISPYRQLDGAGKERDIISIDSNSSDIVSDSDFPDICDIVVSSRPVRSCSPLHRSRSDTSNFRSRPDAPRLAAARTAGTRPAEQKQKRAAETAAAKERKRHERELAKEKKAREKQRAAALAEANKLRTDKKVSTPEIIVDLPSCLASEHREQIQVLLAELGVEYATWESPLQGIVKWRRKVTSRFDLDLGRWEPVAPHVREERHALAILTAEEFVEFILSHELDAYADRIKQHFGDYQILSLTGHDRVAAQEPQHSKPPIYVKTEYVPEDDVEDALLRLQVSHSVFIHHTAAPMETAKWVVTFTQHVSTIPYRKQKDHAMLTTGFCMESGQVRTGDGPKDTYVRMLQEIVRVTAPIAYGVANEFDSVGQLVRGLVQGGPERLEGVQKSANKDGHLTDRVLGPALSRRLYKVFTGRDDTSTDV